MLKMVETSYFIWFPLPDYLHEFRCLIVGLPEGISHMHTEFIEVPCLYRCFAWSDHNGRKSVD